MTFARAVRAEGHLIDTGLMSRYLGVVLEGGGRYAIRRFEVGKGRTDYSTAEIEVRAPSRARLRAILDNLVAIGCRLVEERPARLVPAPRDGVAPEGFTSTTHHRTRVRLAGGWRPVEGTRMDAVVVVRDGRARCALLRDLRRGDPVVCGVEGVEILPPFRAREPKAFAFMKSEASSERALEVKVRAVARAMRRVRARGGRIVAVPGPVVVHTGGAPHLAALVRRGWIDALLSGNALAVHDAERALFGTSLGVDLRTGLPAREGHMNHLRAINEIRAAGSLARAVARGRLRSGILHACVRAGVPFVLAGSIRDDGPLPETEMDLLRAQARYARALRGAGLVLVLGSMLHGIGVGNMLPSDVPLVCVDIHPAVVTKLADRGSGQAIGVVTDAGVFLHRLARAPGPGEAARVTLHEDARAIFDAGLAGVEPRSLVLRHLAARGPFEEERVFVVGSGKAAVAMASAAEEAVGDRIAGGAVVTKRGHALEPLRLVEVREGRHPVPDASCAEGARRILEVVAGAGEGDRILCLLSGGASSLLALPREGIEVDAYAQFCAHLLRTGAPIEEMNAIRRHLTVLGGGGLAAAAHPRPVTTLILSDVLGNSLPAIGSGPTAPDPSTFGDALDAVQRWGLFPFASPGILALLGKGMVGREPETRKPGDPVFERVENAIVGDNALALEAARARAEALGYETTVLTGSLCGDAALAGKAVALAARGAREGGARRAAFLAGGETTVSLENAAGFGGRAQELALAAALALEGSEGVVLLAAGTDGNDGPTDAAGAVVDGGTARGARAVGESPEEALAKHNSYGFFQEIGGHVKTGPTGTNVMDLVIALVG